MVLLAAQLVADQVGGFSQGGAMALLSVHPAIASCKSKIVICPKPRIQLKRSQLRSQLRGKLRKQLQYRL